MEVGGPTPKIPENSPGPVSLSAKKNGKLSTQSFSETRQTLSETTAPNMVFVWNEIAVVVSASEGGMYVELSAELYSYS